MKVSDYIVKCLKANGVTHIYGYIGGAVTHLVDSIYKDTDIKFIQCYHEQAAAFGASASAKYSGKLKVAIATSGPGATNLITGIADAYFDSAPVLFLTGQVNTYDFKFERPVRQFGFQETDIVKIVKPITKYSVLVDDSSKIESTMEKAITTAISGRPGPVLVDIPLNIQREDITPKSISAPVADDVFTIEEKDLREAYQMIMRAKQPLILAGGGCRISNAAKELVLFAESLYIPAVVSLMGKDCFPHDHPLYGGFIGAYGNRFGNMALSKCDLLIVLGSRLDSRQIGNVTDYLLKKEIIQVDIDRYEIGQRIPIKKCIISDVKAFLISFTGFLQDQDKPCKDHSNWLRFIKELKLLWPAEGEPRKANSDVFHYNVMAEISRNLKPDDVVCVDVGQNQMLAAQVLDMKGEQRFINSGGMAPMGYALPAGIAIALENQRRTIVIVGDGGMQMNIQELNSVGNLHLPIIIFLFNNKSLGMIKQFQSLYFESRYCATDETCGYYPIDFINVAKAYGINAIRVTNMMSEWREKIQSALSMPSRLPLLVQIDLDYQTYIYPKLEFDKPIDKPDPQLSAEEESGLDYLMKELEII
jgi:acetolactate synthase-1/2/3 large subunit